MSSDFTRQYAPTIDGIRPDHVARYQFASEVIPKNTYTLDLACGCGYGSWLMEKAGLFVTGVDIEPEAIAYAQRHYKGPTYLCKEAADVKGKWGALVSFETIEHLKNPAQLFQGIEARRLICSVPNEDLYPFSADTFKSDKYPHLRHYTPSQLEAFLESVGYGVESWHCQKDKRSPVTEGKDGMFLIAVCRAG